MVEPGNTDWVAQIAAAQAWWREAGVDLTFADEPTDWLAAAKPQTAEAPADKPKAQQPTPTPPRPKLGGDRSSWPTALADFAPWWLTEPTLDPAPAARRVPPAGPAGAELMIIVPTPEAEDREALLAGAQGRLLDAILAAFGYRREAVYLAAALPCPTPAADWTALAADGLGSVLAHHVMLAAPKRLMVFGRGISPLLGHDPPQAAQALLEFNHDGGSVPLAYAPALDALLERPAWKRGLWRRWLEWTGT